jgi:NitT/TauT family transport system substrate-binding protein
MSLGPQRTNLKFLESPEMFMVRPFLSLLILCLAAAAHAAPIKIGYSAWPGWFPWLIAEKQGIFKKNGVDVQMVWFDDYLQSIEAFSQGKIDGNSMTLIDALSAAASGKKLKVVLVNDNSTGNDQIIAKKEIKSLVELKGKSVAAEAGTVDHFLLLVALAEVGLSEKDIRFKNLPTDKAAKEFAEGKLDAVAVFAPNTTVALKTDKGHVLKSSKDFPGLIPDNLVISEESLKTRDADVRKIIDAWFETLNWMKANKAASIKILAEKAGVTEAEYQSYEDGTTLFSLADNVKAFDPKTKESIGLHSTGAKIVKYLKENNFISRPVSVEKILEPKFIGAKKPAR